VAAEHVKRTASALENGRRNLGDPLSSALLILAAVAAKGFFAWLFPAIAAGQAYRVAWPWVPAAYPAAPVAVAAVFAGPRSASTPCCACSPSSSPTTSAVRTPACWRSRRSPWWPAASARSRSTSCAASSRSTASARSASWCSGWRCSRRWRWRAPSSSWPPPQRGQGQPVPRQRHRHPARRRLRARPAGRALPRPPAARLHVPGERSVARRPAAVLRLLGQAAPGPGGHRPRTGADGRGGARRRADHPALDEQDLAHRVLGPAAGQGPRAHLAERPVCHAHDPLQLRRSSPAIAAGKGEQHAQSRPPAS